MIEVVHLFEVFKAIFYFKFYKLGNVLFGAAEVLMNLNIIRFHLKFEFE
jgi:hypothetical protein